MTMNETTIYALVQVKGHQYQVAQGQKLLVPFLSEKKEGDAMEISEVLLFKNAQGVSVGRPFLSNVPVLATVVRHLKGEKIRVSRFKAKSRYRRVSGFRPIHTEILITQLGKSKKEETSTIIPEKKPRTRTKTKVS